MRLESASADSARITTLARSTAAPARLDDRLGVLQSVIPTLEHAGTSDQWQTVAAAEDDVTDADRMRGGLVHGAESNVAWARTDLLLCILR